MPLDQRKQAAEYEALTRSNIFFAVIVLWGIFFAIAILHRVFL
jgi:hypothetical protein